MSNLKQWCESIISTNDEKEEKIEDYKEIEDQKRKQIVKIEIPIEHTQGYIKRKVVTVKMKIGNKEYNVPQPRY